MGTGILSYFAASVGAKRGNEDSCNYGFIFIMSVVYGVEACKNMTEQVQKIINHNSLTNTVIVLPGLMESVTMPEKVDIIVSEWMGYMLLYESMLDSIIYARDNYLKPVSTIIFDVCRLEY